MAAGKTADELAQENAAFANMLRGAQAAEVRLGLPSGFTMNISTEDDWSFILKLHGIVDAALEQTIRTRCFAERYGVFSRDEALLDKLCSGLNFDGRVSKLSFARAFKLTDEQGLAFCRALSTIRNIYAHKVANHSRALAEIAVESGNPRLLQDLIRIPPDVYDVKEAGQFRILAAMSAMSFLWQLEFRAQPPRSLLAELILHPGDRLVDTPAEPKGTEGGSQR